jgi:gamma-glutamylcyclotransferase
VHGVIYSVSHADSRSLDQAEDAGQGYDRVRLRVSARGRYRAVFTYVARPTAIDTELRPFDWYLEYILRGARYHRLPGRYVKQISRAAPLRDATAARRQRHMGAISRCARQAQSR